MGHKGVYSGLDILADEIETLFSHDSLLSRHLFTIKLYHRINIFGTDRLNRRVSANPQLEQKATSRKARYAMMRFEL
jgi:hypothetical protein